MSIYSFLSNEINEEINKFLNILSKKLNLDLKKFKKTCKKKIKPKKKIFSFIEMKKSNYNCNEYSNSYLIFDNKFLINKKTYIVEKKIVKNIEENLNFLDFLELKNLNLFFKYPKLVC